MEIFLVGGAVRDSLLGRAVSERDWVVVGAELRECGADALVGVDRFEAERDERGDARCVELTGWAGLPQP